jgi:hypothetical protein
MVKRNGASAVSEIEAPEFTVRTVCATVRGTQLSWSREIDACPKKGDYQQHEEQNWRSRLHIQNEEIVIPVMALKIAMQEAAKGMGIPGKGKATYAQPFKAGVTPLAEFVGTGVKAADATPEWRFVPSNPSNNKPGQGGRVHKCFPLIQSWTATVEFHVFDDQITEGVFHQILTRAGMMIGVGRFRPANGGFYGRFSVENIEWK